ncbi:sulfatase-like hydrolase/transferase, partial [bacterium]|nr:sulfatase-like hydrolase/transferase [bacterium]
PWQPTWVQWLADAGYHCVNIGKMHINPYQAMGGFHQRFVVENKDRPLFLDEHPRAFYDEWDKALKSHNIVKPSRYNRYAEDPDGYEKAIGCFLWDDDEQLHSDFFVGNTVKWWLDDRSAEAPLFLQIGFPGPHPPYDPSPRFLAMYEDADIPVPRPTEAELERQPRAQAALRQNMIDFNFDSIRWRHLPPPDDLLKIRRHYAANVSMIDEKIGEIIAALGRNGYLENSIVIFTSDHADALGDHGHIQKWTMYDTVLRVPLVFWAPGLDLKPATVATPMELMDVAPTILEAAGLPEPRVVNGVPQHPMDGISMVYSFNDAAAKDQHTTQYFEMFGNRAMYRDGWLARTIHRAPWEAKPRRPLADDIWELYDTRSDFSLTNDLSGKYPEKLAELQALFMYEAEMNHVLPIDDRVFERIVAANVNRPELLAGRTSLTLADGMTGMTENVFLSLKNKSSTVTAEVEIPEGSPAHGIIIAQGGRFGGWALYVKDGKPAYDYNFLGM